LKSDIYNEVISIMQDGCEKHKEVIVEDIKIITDMLLWGDKHEDTFFEYKHTSSTFRKITIYLPF